MRGTNRMIFETWLLAKMCADCWLFRTPSGGRENGQSERSRPRFGNFARTAGSAVGIPLVEGRRPSQRHQTVGRLHGRVRTVLAHLGVLRKRIPSVASCFRLRDHTGRGVERNR